jgi:hypothetical protein
MTIFSIKEEKKMKMMIKDFGRGRRLLAIALALGIAIAATAAISLPQPVYAFNGYLEDCDFDGYDDETGAPVPWYGFDETKGDAVPSDWDGVAGSYSFSSGSTNNNSNSNSNTSTGSNSSSTSTSNTNTNTSSGTSSQTAAGASNGTSTTVGSQAQTSETEAVTTKANLSAEEQAKIKEVVSVKGKLAILPEKDGEKFYSGSKVTIKGEGFKGSISDYTAEIHSDEVIKLADFDTKADGSFEVTVSLPKDLPAGRHNIWILYKETPVVQKSLDVVTKGKVVKEDAAAEEESGGLTVGFAGFVILLSVAALAAVALIARNVAKKRKLLQNPDEASDI